MGEGEVVLGVPEAQCVTIADVEAGGAVAELAAGKGELVGLALWLLAERARGPGSPWAGLLGGLEAPDSPLLWGEAEAEELLQGTSVLEDLRARRKELLGLWARIQADLDAARGGGSGSFPADVFTWEAFLEAFVTVLARSFYLPSAGVFALVPGLNRVPKASRGACTVDYDVARAEVTLVARRAHTRGEVFQIVDDRPNAERLLLNGEFEDDNPMDACFVDMELVAADTNYSIKLQVAEAAGYTAKERFPLHYDRMPLQMLAYSRLARIGDVAELAKVNFEDDVRISEANEYEVLMLLMGDIQEKLGRFAEDEEYDSVLLNRGGLKPREKLAVKQRLVEKGILRSTMDSVRRRLAPIRGVPTKQGMEDPNDEIREIFTAIETLPQRPKELLDGFLGWARGDYDPEFRKKPTSKKGPPREVPPRPW